MENYYERLGVPDTADKAQLKRAYYTLVKRYPPERFPDEYKALRTAYETLSDTEKRGEYDSRLSLPEDAAALMGEAEEQLRLGRDDRAAALYERILTLYPERERVMADLARAYEEQGKTGKASAVWERLCALAPENADYVFELGLCCEQRGWNKKAAGLYRRALDLDDSSADRWMALITNLRLSSDPLELHALARRAIDALAGHGKESLRLYMCALVSLEPGTANDAEEYLAKIARYMRGGGGLDESPERVLLVLLGAARISQRTDWVKYMLEMADTLPQVSGELREMLDEARLAAEIEDSGLSDALHDLFATLMIGCGCEDCRHEIMAIECYMLDNIKEFRQELFRLKAEHPKLYALHAEFFAEASRTRDTEKMLIKRVKYLNRKGLSPAGFGSGNTPPVQVERRTESKVGRNDLCPCGSGKKYKRCCGA